MRLDLCAKIFLLGVCGMHLLDVPTLWAAQLYTAEDLNIQDAVKAVGPNLSGQAAVRSGFTAARSDLATRGTTPARIGLPSTGVTGTATTNGITSARTAVGSSNRGDDITAYGINDAGLVVGSSNISFGSQQCRPNIPDAPPSGTCTLSAVHAVIWMKNDSLRDLGTLPGDTASEASGVNNSTAVVGYSSGPNGARAFLWTPSTGMQNLGTLPGGTTSKARGISDNGLIVGSSSSSGGTRAVLWTRGGIQNLGTLPGDLSSEAYAVNNRGAVVGYSQGPAGTRAFLWTSQNGMQALPSLPGGSVTRALALSDKNEVVGSSGSALGARAVLWNVAGEAQDLQAVVPVPSGVTLFEAVGINANGSILAMGGDERNAHGFHEGSSRAFLLTPTGP